MEVDTAGEDVRARQSLETELRSIGAATDRLYTRWNTALLHRSQHNVDDVHVRVNLLLHVIVLVVDLGCNRTLAILLVHLLHAVLDEVLAVLELVAVVVADDVAQFGFLAAALDAQQVIEALVALGLFRSFALRNHILELYRQSACVHHLALGVACMHAYSLDVNLGTCSVEVLIFQVAQVATVHGVSPVATKLLHVEVMGSHADLLVRIEAHTDVAMLDFVVVAQVAHRLYNLGDARLVVGAKQGSAVGHDDVLALVSFQLREFLYARDDARAQLDVFAVIILDDASLDVLSAGIRRCIHVGDKSDGRSFFLGIALEGGVDVAHVVHLHIGETFFLKLMFQVLGEVELLRRARHTVGVLARLCVEFSVVYKTFY